MVEKNLLKGKASPHPSKLALLMVNASCCSFRIVIESCVQSYIKFTLGFIYNTIEAGQFM